MDDKQILEALLRTKMGYVKNAKICKNCTKFNNNNCYLNGAVILIVNENSGCDYWKV